jgi:hypothetical protein
MQPGKKRSLVECLDPRHPTFCIVITGGVRQSTGCLEPRLLTLDLYPSGRNSRSGCDPYPAERPARLPLLCLSSAIMDTVAWRAHDAAPTPATTADALTMFADYPSALTPSSAATSARVPPTPPVRHLPRSAKVDRPN